ESRQAFVSKCQSYVQEGIGLVIVDVVTERRANLHNELMRQLQQSDGSFLASELYAVAYRPIRCDEQNQLEIRPSILEIGRPLPTAPLWLRGGFWLPV